MAPRAPRPGTTPNSVRKKAKRSGFRVTIGDAVYELRSADIGPGDDMLVRRITGYPLSQFLTAGTFGLDSAAVIVWMARRKAGERKLSLQKVLDEMPSFEELDELAENDEFEVEPIADFDDAPSSVDVLELEGEEIVADPLPSAGT